MLSAYHVHVVLVPCGDDGEAGAGMGAGDHLQGHVDGNGDRQGGPI